MIRTLIILSTLATTLVAGGVLAAGNDDTVVLNKRIFLGDLDLKTKQGAAQALNRIDVIARQGCSAPGALTVLNQTSPAFQRCHDRAVERAVTQVNQPMLTAALGAARSNDKLALSQR